MHLKELKCTLKCSLVKMHLELLRSEAWIIGEGPRDLEGPNLKKLKETLSELASKQASKLAS